MIYILNEFVTIKKMNRKTVGRPFMRIITLADVRVPLKKGKKVRKLGSDWVACSFKCEKLPSFSFICGLLGHIDQHCEEYYHLP